MSDSMERDKNVSLSTKENVDEEEDVKRELMAMGMYEPSDSYEHMKKILVFINESKDMANKVNDKKDAQEEPQHSSNGCSLKTVVNKNLAQELDMQEDNDNIRLIHSHKSNHASPILDQKSTRSSASPEPVSTMLDSRNFVHRRKSSDSDVMTDKSHDSPNIRDTSSLSTNRYSSSRPKTTLKESYNTHMTEVRMETLSDHNQKLDRWRIDPFDFCIQENDVPLRQLDRPLSQEPKPFRSFKDVQSPEAIQKLLVSLNLHLKQTAELWHSWHRTDDTKFQWGSPIQVETAKSSSDKKLLMNNKTEQHMEFARKHSHDRINKRKSTVVSSPSRDYSQSDDDENTEFVIKRKKIQSDEGISKVLQPTKQIRVTKDIMSASLLKDNDDQILNNSKINTSLGKNSQNLQAGFEQKCEEEDRLSPELISVYPRRIVPPNPRKSIKKKQNINIGTNSPSIRSNDEEDALSLTLKNEIDCSIEKDTSAKLEKKSEKSSVETASKHVEIKPLPMKGLSIRLERQSMLLKKFEMEKKKKLEIENEEIQRREEEERKRKEEFYKRSIEERQMKDKQKEEIQRLRNEKSLQWNKRLKDSKGKLPESCKNPRLTLTEEEEENILLQDSSSSEDEQIQSSEVCLINNVNCPICNQSFSTDKIEMHAAVCEQYNTDDDEDNSYSNLLQNKTIGKKKGATSSDILECGICSKYRTTNGIDYEVHVNNCLQKRNEQEHSKSYERTNIGLDIPTSPVRCYRPISEQTNSEIDYKAQFATKTKTRGHPSKKRRR